MHKGVVLDIRGERATVLAKGGEFRDISIRGMASVRIGQEINMPQPVPTFAWWSTLGRIRVAAVAMVLVAVLMPIGYLQFIAPGPVMAYVGLDINPSIEFGVDRNSRVIEAKGLGEDGQGMLDAVEWKNKHLEQVVAALVRVGEIEGYVKVDAENSLVITVVPRDAELPRGLEKRIEQIPQAITSKRKASDASVVARVIHGDKELADTAKELGITPGKTAVLFEAVEQGLQITVTDMKNEKITESVPKAGGKTEDVLDKASDRDSKTWGKLIEKHEEKIKKQDPKGNPDQDPGSPGKSGDKPGKADQQEPAPGQGPDTGTSKPSGSGQGGKSGH